MKQTAATILNFTVFIALLLAVCYYYQYHEIMQLRPQSVHKWRQSDCASLALNYYQHQLSFFKPHTHNLTSDQGKSSACATSEVPILYYTVAKLYQLFGYHDFIFRFINTLIFLTGLIFLYLWFQLVLRSAYWSILGTLFLFSSPVLVYYGNNYLSDSSALSFSIIAWYFYYRYITFKKQTSFYISILLFTLAAFCKLTALINVFAIMVYWAIQYIGKNYLKHIDDPEHWSLKKFLWFISIPLMTFAWVVYARDYNANHDCSYFSTNLFPIWEYSGTQILELLEHMYVNWGKAYFHPISLCFLWLSFVLGIYFFRQTDKRLSVISYILAAECLLIFILQFWAFADHDYYAINFYILVVFVVMMFLKETLKLNTRIMNAWHVKLGATCFVLFNIYHARQILDERYTGWANDYKDNIEYYELDSFLKQHGISKYDTIISIPDKSHASLYLMNLKGWTLYTDARFNRDTPVKYNQDSLGIVKSIANGAHYLFIRGYDEMKRREYLHTFCTHLVAKKDELYLFDLRNKELNFSLAKEVTLHHYLCNAEALSENGLYFLSVADSMLFEFGPHQSGAYSKNGNFSIALQKEKPFGMTIRIRDTRSGEFIRLEVWRYDPKSTQTGMIAAIPSRNIYYNNFGVVEKEGDWERLQMQFEVDSSQAGEMLEIYLYNPKEDWVYFDDFSIRRYELK